MKTLTGMLEEARDEMVEEDDKACKEGLKVLIGRKEKAEKELEEYKELIKNDARSAADRFRGDSMGRFR